MGDEFSHIFPSHGKGDAENNKAETSVLRLLLCLPAEYVSPDFLKALLGSGFPLEEALAALVERGLIRRDGENGNCLLLPASRFLPGENFRPGIKDAVPLMAFVAEHLARNGADIRDWICLGRTVLEQFRTSREPEAVEFRHVLIKKLCETGSYEEARELLEIQDSRPETACSAARPTLGQNGLEENVRILLPYVSACDVLIVNRGQSAVGLCYDEENMFVPIIAVLERGIMATALIDAAENLGIPVVENAMLAENLISYGRLGESVPDLCFREVAAAIARFFPRKNRRPVFRRKGRTAPKPRPLKVELGEAVRCFLDESGGIVPLLAEPLDGIRKRLQRLLGYSLPLIKISGNGKLKGSEYRILFKGIEAGRGRLDLGWFVSADLGFPPDLLEIAAEAGAGIILRHAREIALRRAPDLLGRDEVQAILDAAEEKYPVVTGEVKSFLSLGSIRDILRSLIGEQVSIRHMPVILETLADWGSFGPTPSEVIIEQIRSSLKRQICQEYADDRQILRVLTLDSKLEQRFADRIIPREGEEKNSGSSWDEWMEAFSPAIRGMEERGLPPIILCSPASRSWVKEITRKKFPDLAVLSYVEIPPDMNVEPVGEIRLEDGAV
jgi:flagellar biosynthesis protein FlhA